MWENGHLIDLNAQEKRNFHELLYGICTAPRHILEMFINYFLEQECQVICYGDDAQPPPFFGVMPYKHADYYEVISDY